MQEGVTACLQQAMWEARTWLTVAERVGDSCHAAVRTSGIKCAHRADGERVEGSCARCTSSLSIPIKVWNPEKNSSVAALSRSRVRKTSAEGAASGGGKER